jgi:glycosyltransferase involved in cell wall biosynthesis
MVTSYGVIGAYINYQPLVVSAWGSDILYLADRYWPYRKIARWVLNKAQLVTASAEIMREALIKLGVDRKKIVTHHYGIDTARFNTKVRWGKKKSKTIILCTRYFERPQNVADFIKAIPCVLKRLSQEDVEFWVIGSGSEEKRIKTLSTKLNLNGIVRFLGEIPHEKMPYYYGLADIYVSPSITDTNHVSLTEAMACGVFPVVTDIPANRAWIVDGVNGLLAAVGNPEVLGQKIAEAVERIELREEAVTKNLEIIRNKALWEDNIRKLEIYYQRILQK